MPRYPNPNVKTPAASDIKKFVTLVPLNLPLDAGSRDEARIPGPPAAIARTIGSARRESNGDAAPLCPLRLAVASRFATLVTPGVVGNMFRERVASRIIFLTIRIHAMFASMMIQTSSPFSLASPSLGGALRAIRAQKFGENEKGIGASASP